MRSINIVSWLNWAVWIFRLTKLSEGWSLGNMATFGVQFLYINMLCNSSNFPWLGVQLLQDNSSSWKNPTIYIFTHLNRNIPSRSYYQLVTCMDIQLKEILMYFCVCDLLVSPPILLSVFGLRISLSSMLTIWLNLGRSLRSLCQHSNMSWCNATGHSIGAGNL